VGVLAVTVTSEADRKGQRPATGPVSRRRRKLWRNLRKVRRIPILLQYLYYHKVLFGIENTRFNISFCVFKESFLGDQYGLRAFLEATGPIKRLTFLDLGRNHGFVFYYFLYFAKKMGASISEIDYVGIDPSPLKFVYHPGWKGGPKINYRLIDKAIVFDDERTVRLKYGERNFGNFNVSGSNFEDNRRSIQAQYDYIEIEVDAIGVDELEALLPQPEPGDATIVKIDCKNRTEVLFTRFLKLLRQREQPHLVACERDGSSEQDVSRFAGRSGGLVASNLF
jgi:hypothetical protein